MGDSTHHMAATAVPLSLIATTGTEGAAGPRKFLKSRNEEFALTTVAVGKVAVVGGGANAAEVARTGGFYCKLCDCALKDTVTWLNHINGRKHNLALGMKMQVEQATAAEVAARIQWHADQRHLRRHATETEKRLLITARSDALTAEAETERREAAGRRRMKRARADDFD